MTKRHRFRRRRRFVEQRSICDLHRREIGDHRLKIQQRFESALGDFRLIRRVGGVPAGILQNVSLNHRRRDAIGITGADKRLRATLFFLEIARSSASASASDFASGKLSARSSRIFFGTVASISASRSSKPTSRSISAILRIVRPNVAAGEGIRFRYFLRAIALNGDYEARKTRFKFRRFANCGQPRLYVES